MSESLFLANIRFFFYDGGTAESVYRTGWLRGGHAAGQELECGQRGGVSSFGGGSGWDDLSGFEVGVGLDGQGSGFSLCLPG
jgi:hypothetical protein